MDGRITSLKILPRSVGLMPPISTLDPFRGEGPTPRASIAVALVDSQSIYRAGISRILATEPDIEIIAQAESLSEALAAVSRCHVDLLLLEQDVSPAPGEAISELLAHYPSLRLIVLADQVEERETLELVRRGVRGLVCRSIAPELLVRCVRSVAAGEVWLNPRGLNWLIDAYRAQAAQMHPAGARKALSQKELLVIAGVTRGLRNQDIALEIGASEQVVKNCLRKIYDKLGSTMGSNWRFTPCKNGCWNPDQLGSQIRPRVIHSVAVNSFRFHRIMGRVVAVSFGAPGAFIPILPCT